MPEGMAPAPTRIVYRDFTSSAKNGNADASTRNDLAAGDSYSFAMPYAAIRSLGTSASSMTSRKDSCGASNSGR